MSEEPGISPNPEQKGDHAFPPTRWTMVRKATDLDEPESFDALSKLCETYWYPLYAFVRSQGAPAEEAADDVQGFFAALLEKDFLATADEEKGKLRTFLIQALKRYRANQYRASQAQKRGGGQPALSIDKEWAEGRYEVEPVDELTPEQLLDRSWARLLLDRVMTGLENEFSEKGKQEEFEVMKKYLAWKSGELSYAEGAEQLGISEGNLKIKVHRLRAQYRSRLENEVRDTLDSANSKDDMESELRHLMEALG